MDPRITNHLGISASLKFTKTMNDIDIGDIPSTIRQCDERRECLTTETVADMLHEAFTIHQEAMEVMKRG